MIKLYPPLRQRKNQYLIYSGDILRKKTHPGKWVHKSGISIVNEQPCIRHNRPLMRWNLLGSKWVVWWKKLEGRIDFVFDCKHIRLVVTVYGKCRFLSQMFVNNYCFDCMHDQRGPYFCNRYHRYSSATSMYIHLVYSFWVLFVADLIEKSNSSFLLSFACYISLSRCITKKILRSFHLKN